MRRRAALCARVLVDVGRAARAPLLGRVHAPGALAGRAAREARPLLLEAVELAQRQGFVELQGRADAALRALVIAMGGR